MLRSPVGVDCLLCQASVPPERNYHIFTKKASKKGNVAEILSRILEIPVERERIHSQYMCMNCELTCREFSGVERRLLEIREQVIEKYTQAVSSVEYVEVSDLKAKEEIFEHVIDEFDENAEEQEEVFMESQDTEIVEQDDQQQVVIMSAEEAAAADSESIITFASGADEQDSHLMDVPEESDIYYENAQDTESEDDEETEKMSGLKKGIYTKKDDSFVCNLCLNDKVFSDPTKFTLHMKMVHDEKIFLCDICGLDCHRRMYLLKHIESHSSEIHEGTRKSGQSAAKSWYCQLCAKSYGSKNLLEEHMNMHTGDRPYKCPECPKDFASKYTLAAHARIHTSRPRPYSCSMCDKKFLTGQNLIHHERTHLGVKEYKCDMCDKAFGSSHNLRVHKIVHSGKKPFLCRTCGKSFARRAEVRDHERIHTGEKPFKCEICSMAFAQRSNLQSHKRATHLNDKRYKCDLCDKTFKRRRLLDYHTQAAHTGERPYKCDLCTSSFVYPEHFKKHLLIHSNEKKYTCEVCGKGFNNRDNRNIHRFVHSDKKPFECVQCGMGFMRKMVLFAHMKSEGHLSDTIIVNQPRINVDSKTSNEDDLNSELMENATTFVITSEEQIQDANDAALEEDSLDDGKSQ
ncbi:uncharacterized protein DMENIID0001_108360 [Sergentomyia squamirostris]